jgi:hypothetical protein
MRHSDDQYLRVSPAKTPARRCRLICVDPACIGEVWPQVRPLIQRAMQRGDLSSLRAVEDAVLAGDALLWLAISHEDGREVCAAAVTELAQTEWRKVCVIVACGAATPSRAGMRRWLGLIAGIEDYAQAEGCSATRIIGRQGWARMLTAYRPKRVVLEKELH